MIMTSTKVEPGRPPIEIRPLTEIEEFRGCVEMQQVVWGFDELDVMPLRFFIVASRIGGQVFGAFAEKNEMVGFLCALAGQKENLPYIHSHMLAVLPEYQNQGVARRLKLAQRDDAIKKGYRLIEWTFDPLELKNAYFNIEKLGIVVRHYSPNHYGTTSSRLQGGLPTDRMIAEWWIQSDRVKAILGEREVAVQRSAGKGRVEIPSGVVSWKSQDLPRARKIQEQVRGEFLSFFGNGYCVTGFVRGQELSVYILMESMNVINPSNCK
jgi:predicted GNAT superfamily acetyltransferase